jgi:hypothetical protein
MERTRSHVKKAPFEKKMTLFHSWTCKKKKVELTLHEYCMLKFPVEVFLLNFKNQDWFFLNAWCIIYMNIPCLSLQSNHATLFWILQAQVCSRRLNGRLLNFKNQDWFFLDHVHEQSMLKFAVNVSLLNIKIKKFLFVYSDAAAWHQHTKSDCWGS